MKNMGSVLVPTKPPRFGLIVLGKRMSLQEKQHLQLIFIKTLRDREENLHLNQ